MIARRLITILLCFLFLMILELNQNSVWGWILTIAATVGFFVLFERKMLPAVPWKICAWVGYVALFAVVLLITFPAERRVPAFSGKSGGETDVVSLKNGKVTGVVNPDGDVELYAGIPYAAPPVGDLRWKEPQDPANWDGVLKADHFAPMAMQPRNLPIIDSLARIIGYHDYNWFDFHDNYAPAVSEDALYVNVWKPAGEQKELPVLVYVHGGSLKTGQPWYEDYSGEGMARDGVIVVNMGYRLGVFGYLALPELADESPNATTGNYGLLDQIKALEWVRDNIKAFGGDPDNVTLAGESAGAASVSALCTSPLAKGLFKRVILESSTVACEQPPHSFRNFDQAIEDGKKVLERYAAKDLSDLRKLPASKIVSSAETEHHITIDGYALTETPYKSYQKGIHNEEAILHGFNRLESAPFLLFTKTTTASMEREIKAYFKEYADDVLSLYAARDDKSASENWAEIYGAVFFDYPHHALNKAAVQNNIPVYEYYFTKENKRLSCWHSGEEVYCYGNIPDGSKLYEENDRDLSGIMKAYWVNFVKTGDPNGDGLPIWDQNPDGLHYLELGDRVGPVTESSRKTELFRILEQMQKTNK